MGGQGNTNDRQRLSAKLQSRERMKRKKKGRTIKRRRIHRKERGGKGNIYCPRVKNYETNGSKKGQPMKRTSLLVKGKLRITRCAKIPRAAGEAS